MQISNEEAERLMRKGVDALRLAQPAEARLCFEKVAQSGRESGQLWLLLAVACRAADDVAAEEAAVDRLLAVEPRAVRGHIMKADCRAKAGDDRASLGFYESALMIAEGQRLPADLAAEVRRAEGAVAQVKEQLDKRRESALAARGLPAGSRSTRFQQSVDILAGRKRIFVQEPTGYYFPGLPQIQFYEPALFDWVAGIEAAAGVIRQELSAVLAEGTKGFRPYLRSDPNQPRVDDNQLLDSNDWSALFLCENGRLFEETITRCPRTWDAVQTAPLPRIPNSPTVMFSLLRGGARISPHTGTHNVRLICHLPLIVPPDCGFRVGNEVRQWEEGKLLIFDDSIEHEAWNNSTQDRVVLIFDIWRPELSDQERQEVAALFAGPSLD